MVLVNWLRHHTCRKCGMKWEDLGKEYGWIACTCFTPKLAEGPQTIHSSCLGMFKNLKRWLESKKRVKNWQVARDQYRRTHYRCAFCGIRSNLEVHDKFPYHCLPDPAGKTVDWWIDNFILLCKQDHRMQAHNGDPACLDYLPQIRELARSVTDTRTEYVTRC